MQKGDRIRLKDGRHATITGVGIGDFASDCFPIYVTVEDGTTTVLMSNELKRREKGTL